MLILGRVTGADQGRQEQLAATLGRRPGTDPERHRNGSRLPDQGRKVVSTEGTGGLRIDPSVAPEPAWRLDALQFGKIKPANRLQLVCERGLLKIVGQMVEPRLIAILEVEQGAYRILPALRSGPAVLRPAVLHPGLLCLAALSIAPLSLCVRQSQCLCAPLRNGVPVGTLGIQLAHRISLQVDAVGAVHDAVADRIGDGGLADYLMPGRHR